MSQEFGPLQRSVVEKEYEENIPFFQAILRELSDRLEGELEGLGIHPTIKSRVKSFDSFYKKILRNLEDPARRDNAYSINDTLGIRIVCPFLENIRTAEELIRDMYNVVEIERKGAEQSFKEFGYASTHFLVNVPQEILMLYQFGRDLICEIQVRTILQDAWAEVEHEIVYKADFTPFDDPLKRKLAALNANLTLSDIIFQEIRDYQTQLQLELQKRRVTFMNKVQNGFREHTEPDLDMDLLPGTHHVASIDDLLLKALYAHNDNQFKKAIAIYSRILTMPMKKHVRGIILIHRGMAYFAESFFDAAMEDFTEAIRVDGKNAKAYCYRGIVYKMRKEYTRALEDLDISVSLKPFDFDALYSRAQVGYKLGDYSAALRDVTEALNIDPDSRQARNLLSILQQRESRGETSDKEFSEEPETPKSTRTA